MKAWIWILIIVALAASAFFVGRYIGKYAQKNDKPLNGKTSDKPLTAEQKEKIKKFKKELELLDREISETAIAGTARMSGGASPHSLAIAKRKKFIEQINLEICGEGMQMSTVCNKCVKIGSVSCPPTWTPGA